MRKNISGQTWRIFAFDKTTGDAITGDAANISANLYIDTNPIQAVTDTHPTELSLGYYEFNLTQAETNGDCLTLIPASTTADVQVIGLPGSIYTVDYPSIAAAIFSYVIEGTRTFIQWVRLIASLNYGNRTVSNGVQNYRDEANTKNRIVATLGTDSTRTITTRDGD